MVKIFNTLQFGTRLVPVSLEKCCHTVGPATASEMIYTLCASYTFRLPGRYWEEKGFVLPSPFPATLYPRCFILIEVTCCGEIGRVTFGQPRVALHPLPKPLGAVVGEPLLKQRLLFSLLEWNPT